MVPYLHHRLLGNLFSSPGGPFTTMQVVTGHLKQLLTASPCLCHLLFVSGTWAGGPGSLSPRLKRFHQSSPIQAAEQWYSLWYVSLEIWLNWKSEWKELEDLTERPCRSWEEQSFLTMWSNTSQRQPHDSSMQRWWEKEGWSTCLTYQKDHMPPKKEKPKQTPLHS